jgi:DNA topoisomerase-1
LMLQTPEPTKSSRRLLRKLRLHRISRSDLTIERRANGDNEFVYFNEGEQIEDEEQLERFRKLAVPPAYQDVRFAADPKAHIQAVGRDDAGRLQYRYHAQWIKLRESKKSQRLLSLVTALPRVRKRVSEILAPAEPTREFAFAAVIELISLSAIRPGNEEYARRHGSRGASTLLKSNVRVSGDRVTLAFRAKGGKDVRKEVNAPRLVRAIAVLRTLPGSRLFQYRDEGGAIRAVNVRQVNVFLREIAGAKISLKDFRTLCASASVLEVLSKQIPRGNTRSRHKQVLAAIRQAADELTNTPAIARKSYVHEAICSAFESDGFEQFGATLKRCRSAAQREKLLAEIITAAIA